MAGANELIIGGTVFEKKKQKKLAVMIYITSIYKATLLYEPIPLQTGFCLSDVISATMGMHEKCDMTF